MLFGKKRKISKYLLTKQTDLEVTAFDDILLDYLSGELKNRLISFEMKHIEIHIDWLPDYKCVGIQAQAKKYYFDIQIEPKIFSVAFDKDEPENVAEYHLTNKNIFYDKIQSVIMGIN